MKGIATTAGIAGPLRHEAHSAAAFRMLLIASDYEPHSIGAGQLVSELCEWLAARGQRVRAITAAQQRHAWFAREQRRNLGIVRYPAWLSKPIALFLALVYSQFWRPNPVVAVAPAGNTCASIYARLTGAKNWLHVRAVDTQGAAIGFPLARMMRRFDVVLTTSEAGLDHLRSLGAKWEKLRYKDFST